MDDTAIDKPVGRRVARRSRRGLSFSDQAIADSTETAGGVSNINAHVESMAIRPVAVLPSPSPSVEGQEESNTIPPTTEEFNPRARMDQVRRRSSQYAKEYIIDLLHRLLMRRIPMDEIAQQLGISISQAYRYRKELNKKLREDAKSLDIESLIGESMAFYGENAAMAMRAASASNLPVAIKLAAMRTALASRNDMHRFLMAAGVYDALRFRPPADGASVSDVRQLMLNTERILSGESGFSTAENTGDDEELEL